MPWAARMCLIPLHKKKENPQMHWPSLKPVKVCRKGGAHTLTFTMGAMVEMCNAVYKGPVLLFAVWLATSRNSAFSGGALSRIEEVV